MIVTTVHVHVKKDKIQDFIDATIENHNNSIKEPGNLRFDVLQSMDDDSIFTLYEAFASEDDAKAHKETAHYNKWRKTVADMMAEPRKGFPHKVIAPSEKSLWKS